MERLTANQNRGRVIRVQTQSGVVLKKKELVSYRQMNSSITRCGVTTGNRPKNCHNNKCSRHGQSTAISKIGGTCRNIGRGVMCFGRRLKKNYGRHPISYRSQQNKKAVRCNNSENEFRYKTTLFLRHPVSGSLQKRLPITDEHVLECRDPQNTGPLFFR